MFSDSSVSLFTYNNEQAKQPMDMYAFIKWPKIKIAAGKTITLTTAKWLKTWEEHERLIEAA